MSELSDALTPQLKVPQEWQQRATWDGDTGEIVTGPISGPPLTDFKEILTTFGYDPDQVEIAGKINQWKKETPSGEWLTSYFFGVKSRAANLDLPTLYQAAAKKPKQTSKPSISGRTTIPVIADFQIGKVGARGGTPELLDRIEEKKELLENHLRKTKPEKIVIPEGGDIFEGFESGGNPMFTNDLSLAQQMDLASTIIYDFVKIAAKYGHVDILSVPSNHTAWRRGKQQLGRPGDDLGILCHKQVNKIAQAAKLDATWHFPPMYDESVTIDVRGTTLGLVHGNQYSPANAIKWWSGQAHGGQPIGSADILIGCHYHHLMVMPSGRNPYTGRSKWFLQAPTLDNGSDWFRNMSGDDSDPGLLVFDITDDGFDLQSLTVL